ncbi:DUF412 family protein [Salmonella enterica subsp. enterica]|nr:DUF412 family protein [Salmonella enterica subsp. enterica]
MEKRRPFFVENRVIRMTPCYMPYDLCRLSPSLHCMLANGAVGGQLDPAVATALFALNFAYAGIMVVGKRSVTPLPPSILNWFTKFAVLLWKLQEAGQALAPVEGKPDAVAARLKRAPSNNWIKLSG